MKIYLVRHGTPLPVEVDREQPLSPQGIEEVNSLANFLSKNLLNPSLILHSSLLRAQQTAKILNKTLKSVLQEHPQLAPNDSIESVCLDIASCREDLMIVGHLPFLSRLLSFLVLNHSEALLADFKCATAVCLAKKGSWMIEWILGVELLKPFFP